MDFHTPLDIANRACQALGVETIGAEGFAEDSLQAFELGFAYDKMRRIELQRNLWRPSIKHVVLRAVDLTSRLLQPVLWSSLTTYAYGALVSDAAGILWMSKLPDNLNRGPGYDVSAWELYCGPLAVQPYSSGTTYYAGEVVYTYTGTGSYAVYLSLISSNSENPATLDTWDPTVTYNDNAIVTYNSVAYQSTTDLNLNQTPGVSAAWTATLTYASGSNKWITLSCALAQMNVVYPLGTGPGSEVTSRNIYRLPANYLREAPQEPKLGSLSYLGAPAALPYNDWLYEGDYIISSMSPNIILRFGADAADVSKFDPQMCEGIALRLAVACGKRLTQSDGALSSVQAQFQKFMTEARMTNGIEEGPEEPPLDDYISCRV